MPFFRPGFAAKQVPLLPPPGIIVSVVITTCLFVNNLSGAHVAGGQTSSTQMEEANQDLGNPA